MRWSPHLVTIAKDDIPLAAMAGAFGNATPTRKVSGLVAAAIMVVKRVAKRQGTDPINIMQRLNEVGQLRAIGQWAKTGELETDVFVPVIAEIFGVTVTMGPIRVHATGEIEIYTNRRWTPATDELLQALDTTRMMGQSGQESIAEMAARVVLDWREKRRQP